LAGRDIEFAFDSRGLPVERLLESQTPVEAHPDVLMVEVEKLLIHVGSPDGAPRE
jgi:hypothetical protein